MFVSTNAPAFVFWPVGCGDSATVVVDPTTNLQIDLNDTTVAEEIDNERIPLVNELVAKLPTINGRPYLSCFALTHPDADHCRGFKRLLKEAVIGELWFTPRVFKEYRKDLHEDALTFRDEALRRVKQTIAVGGDPGRGNRVRIIGYDELLAEAPYVGFPRDLLTIPGHIITGFDGLNLAGRFHAFVHAPFKDDSAGERNETSLALQIGLANPEGGVGFALFLGDLSYPTLRRIVDETRQHDHMKFLTWDLLLSPHHCSKKVMYVRVDGRDVLKNDVINELAACQTQNGIIIASAVTIPDRNYDGDNPPHGKALSRYEEIANRGVICTGEHSRVGDHRPIIAKVMPSGVVIDQSAYALCDDNIALLLAAVEAVQGGGGPPQHKVGFG